MVYEMSNRRLSTVKLWPLVIAALLSGCAEDPEKNSGAAQSAAMKPAAAHGSGNPSAVPAAPAGSAGLKFTAPPEWVSETPSSSMRQAQYKLSRAEGDPEDAELVVF